MKAVILAAGVGTRLRPITDAKPTCLVRPAGREILGYQLDAYAAAEIDEVIVITGYRADAVAAFCSGDRGVRITLIENAEYETTNNMFSLFLAAGHVEGEPFILSNGDVALDADIITAMAGDERADLIAVDAGRHSDESMKIRVDGDGLIVDIS